MPIQPGTYRFRNTKSGTYLDASVKEEGLVHGWASRPGNQNQKWIVEQRGGNYALKNLGDGRYAWIQNQQDGSRVEVSKEATEWSFVDQNGGYVIYAAGTGLVIDLDMGSSDNGASIAVWGFHGADQQIWQAEPEGGQGGGYVGAVPPGAYRIRNAYTGTALDLSGGGANDGTPCIGYHVGTGINQVWHLEQGQNGYTFKNGASGTFAGFREQPTDGVLLSGNSQSVEWQVNQADEGYQLHVASNPSLVVDLADGLKDDGAKICIWTNKNGQNQKWLLEPAQ